MLNVQNNPNFTQQLKDLSIAFLDILKELRSQVIEMFRFLDDLIFNSCFILQVIREACITIAYMCKVLKNKADIFITYILSELINLIQNSAKVSFNLISKIS